MVCLQITTETINKYGNQNVLTTEQFRNMKTLNRIGSVEATENCI